MKEFASESGHWYRPDSTPAYTVIGKNGKERNTSLRDARKEGLYPSVTTILKESAKPGLENWKIDQAVMAALTLKREDGESDEDYIQRIKADAREQAKNAAEKGTLIHGYIEAGLRGDSVPEEGMPYVEVAVSALEADEQTKGVKWEHEKSFACSFKYGGKVDLGPSPILDIKTNEKPVADAKLWDEHLMQLAAYQVGIHGKITEPAGILFINHKDMESRIVWATEEQLVKGWMMFVYLLQYWYAKTGLQN